MRVPFERAVRYLNTPLDLGARGLLFAAALLLIGAFFLPLWQIHVASPTSPSLGAVIYAGRVEPVGAPDESVALTRDHSPDSRWLPFVIGGLALLLLRAAAIGTGRSIVDLSALFGYFLAFSIWSFAGRLDFYGRYLSAPTSGGISLFVPPLFGHERLGDLDVFSLPDAGAIAIVVAGIALVWAGVLSWRRASSEMAAEVRMAA